MLFVRIGIDKDVAVGEKITKLEEEIQPFVVFPSS